MERKLYASVRSGNRTENRKRREEMEAFICKQEGDKVFGKSKTVVERQHLFTTLEEWYFFPLLNDWSLNWVKTLFCLNNIVPRSLVDN